MRFWVTIFITLTTAGIAGLATGCGEATWETNESSAVDQLDYETKLDYNLEPPVSAGALNNFPLTIRPPKGFSLPKDPTGFPGLNAELNVVLTNKSDTARMYLVGINPNRKKTAKPKAKGKSEPKATTPKAPPIKDLKKAVDALLRDRGPETGKKTDKKTPEHSPGSQYTFDRTTFEQAVPMPNRSPIKCRIFYYYLKMEKSYQVAVIFQVPIGMLGTITPTQIDLSMETFSVGVNRSGPVPGGGGGGTPFGFVPARELHH